MTKEEILKAAFSEAINVSGKHWFRDAWFILDPSPSKANILRAMGEYAKGMSIGFHDWLENECDDWYEDSEIIKKPIDRICRTTPELYTLYLKHLEQEP